MPLVMAVEMLCADCARARVRCHARRAGQRWTTKGATAWRPNGSGGAWETETGSVESDPFHGFPPRLEPCLSELSGPRVGRALGAQGLVETPRFGGDLRLLGNLYARRANLNPLVAGAP